MTKWCPSVEITECPACYHTCLRSLSCVFLPTCSCNDYLHMRRDVVLCQLLVSAPFGSDTIQLAIRVRDAPFPSQCFHECRGLVHVTAGTKRQLRITATIALLDVALFPEGCVQSVQVCPVSPRVMWKNVTSHQVKSQEDEVPPTVPWFEWLLVHYARTCWGFPAGLHVAVGLALIFHSHIWAHLLYLRSCCWDQ